jgi:hypothetical protein
MGKMPMLLKSPIANVPILFAKKVPDDTCHTLPQDLKLKFQIPGSARRKNRRRSESTAFFGHPVVGTPRADIGQVSRMVTCFNQDLIRRTSVISNL